MDSAPCEIICITGVISYTVTITPGRDHSTLRDHPAFSRNITHRSLSPEILPSLPSSDFVPSFWRDIWRYKRAHIASRMERHAAHEEHTAIRVSLR